MYFLFKEKILKRLVVEESTVRFSFWRSHYSLNNIMMEEADINNQGKIKRSHL